MDTSSNATINRTILQNFTVLFCSFVDFPDGGIDCSNSEPDICVRCAVEGKYLVGAATDIPSLLYFLWALIVLVSLIGLVHNLLIILVVRRKESNKSFGFLLTFLACIDILVEITAATGETANTAYFGNWTKDKSATMRLSYVAIYMFEVCRSSSSFVTVIICSMHFFMVMFPTKAPNWFTLQKTRLYAALAVATGILLGLPRFLSYHMELNVYKDVPSLRDLDYIAEPSEFGKYMYHNLNGIHNQIDYWFPPPTILFLVLATYYKVRTMAKRRQYLTNREKNTINAGKMFLPVAVCCVVLNMVPVTNVYLLSFGNVTYRELYLIMTMSNAVNSAVNFPIYYYRSGAFRQKTRELLGQVKKQLGLKVVTKSVQLDLLSKHEQGNSSNTTALYTDKTSDT